MYLLNHVLTDFIDRVLQYTFEEYFFWDTLKKSLAHVRVVIILRPTVVVHRSRHLVDDIFYGIPTCLCLLGRTFISGSAIFRCRNNISLESRRQNKYHYTTNENRPAVRLSGPCSLVFVNNY